MMKGWNTMSEKGTSLAQYVEHFGLEILNHGDTYETDKVESTNVNRPDLQILGLFDYFDARRIQVMGKAELTYIMKMSENRRTKVFDDLFSYTIPALVLARNMECPAECLQCARNHGRTLLRTTERTADFTSHTMEYLSKQLAPCITRHGVLLDIYGEGVMITGDSGVGKSESAIELIMRGHRLVADDAVEIRRVADQLIGTAPEVIRNYIELMRIRLSANVHVETKIDVRPDSRTEIAPLIFISLIENAFKHGISPTEPSFIRIHFSESPGEIHCEITNSYHPKSVADKSGSGIGLEQVRKRLELTYPGHYDWQQGVSEDMKEYKSILIIKI